MIKDRDLSQKFRKNSRVVDNITGRNFIVVEAGIDEIGGYPCVYCIGEDGAKVGFDPSRLSKGVARPEMLDSGHEMNIME